MHQHERPKNPPALRPFPLPILTSSLRRLRRTPFVPFQQGWGILFSPCRPSRPLGPTSEPRMSNLPTHHEDHPDVISRNARIGLVLFAIYFSLFLLFLLLNVLTPGTMAKSPFDL